MAEPSDAAPRSPFADDPPLARAVRAADNVLGKVEHVVLVGLGLFLIFVCLYGLVMQHVSTPVDITPDILYTTYLMAMIGGAFATHHRKLLAMDVLNRMVSATPRAWLRVACTVFALVMTAIFFWYSYDVYQKNTAPDAEHWVPDWTEKIALPMGSAIIFIHLMAQLLIDLAYLAGGKLPPEPEMGAV